DDVTVLDHRGAGTLKRVRLTVDTAALDDVALRITWDAEPKPAIDARLGALFGCDPVPAAFETLPMSVEIDGDRATLTLTLPMPFSKRARVVLSNGGASDRGVDARFDGTDGVPSGEWGYLRTVSNHRAAPDLGERYDLSTMGGHGKYVGIVL